MTKAQKALPKKILILGLPAFILGILSDISLDYFQQSKEDQGDFMEFAKMNAKDSALDMSAVFIMIVATIFFLFKPTSIK